MRKQLSVVALGLAALGLWRPQAAEASSTPGGMLARLDKNGAVDAPCPLEHTAVTAEVLEAKGVKCPRCWVYSEAVGQGSDVCPKCRQALS